MIVPGRVRRYHPPVPEPSSPPDRRPDEDRHADPTIATELAGLTLRGPVILAAGTAGTLDEMSDVVDLSRVGAVVTKSITCEPREGNATWRILPAEAGMLNAIGLANVGVERFVAEYGPRVARIPTRVIVSVAGFSVEDYVAAAGALGAIDAIAGVELNVSCPNVHGGPEFGADPSSLAGLVSAVRAVLPRTRLFVKLPPAAVAVGGVGIVALARAAIEGDGRVAAGPAGRPGADVLCLANTTPAMAIDAETRRPLLANITGGLSGPAVHPIAVKLVYDVYRGVAKQTGTPIVGVGGVLRWPHAAEFILAGASAVQIGTGLFADPRCPITIARGLSSWVRRQGKTNIGQLVGAIAL